MLADIAAAEVGFGRGGAVDQLRHLAVGLRSRPASYGWLIPVTAAVGARYGFAVVSLQLQAKTWPDSRTYLEIASQPPSLSHLFYQYPVVVPAVYRLAGSDIDTIVAMQRELAFWSWSGLALTLFFVPRRWTTKILGLFIGLAFLLAPLRIGWANVILSESLNDSLTAALVTSATLFVAGATRIEPSLRRSLICGGMAFLTLAIAFGWLFTRDTNAVMMLAVVPMVGLAWLWTPTLSKKCAAALALLVLCASLFALWTAQVAPDHPTALSVARGWDPEVTPRGWHPLNDNLFMRVLPDNQARSYFEEHGLSVTPELLALVSAPGTPALRAQRGVLIDALSLPMWDERALSDPRYAASRTWLLHHGLATYIGWLLSHPFERLADVIRSSWKILSPPDLSFYMPTGYRSEGVAITADPAVLLMLIATIPFVVTKHRRSPWIGGAVCLVFAGLVGAGAAYYGDAGEIERHSYGAGQMIILGLVLGLLGWIEAGALVWPSRHISAVVCGAPRALKSWLARRD